MSRQAKSVKIGDIDVTEDFLRMMSNKLDLDMPMMKTEIRIMKDMLQHFIDLEFS